MKSLLAKKYSVLIGIILSTTFTLALLKNSPFLSQLEDKLLDLRFKYAHYNMKAHEDIVVLLLDEQTLNNFSDILGRWPWPRSIWSEITEYLSSMEVKSINFDILFSEYQKPKNDKGEIDENDQHLVLANSYHPHITHSMLLYTDIKDDLKNSLLDKPLPTEIVKKHSLQNMTNKQSHHTLYNAYTIPFKELAETTPHLGVVEFSPDSDGVYRRTRLVREYQEHYYPTLSLASFLNEKKSTLLQEDRFLHLNKSKIPLDEKGNYLINHKKTFETFSLGSILSSLQALNEGNVEAMLVGPKQLKDKRIFIGVSAAGGNDLKATPVSKSSPGVFLHASILSNILNNQFLKVIPIFYLYPIFIFLILFCCIGIFTIQSSFLKITPPIFLLLFYLVLSFYLFNGHRIVTPILLPCLNLMVSFFLVYVYYSFTEGKEKRKVRKMLSQYVSPIVLKEVMDKNEGMDAEVGSKENISVLFSDVRGFTTFSENYPPEQVVEMLNFYLNEMVNIVFKYEGTLDKFVGDALMAFWGAPLKAKNHAQLATQAAIEMVHKLREINAHFKEKNYPPFAIGIGINSGEAIVGNIGCEKKLDYTVIGDNVNLASRMEGLTKAYYSELLITESTYQELINVKDNNINCKIFDYVAVKGKDKPVPIYAPILESPASISKDYLNAFQLYKDQSFTKAIETYRKIKDIEKYQGHQDYAQMMIQRCQEFQSNPPGSQWDGVFRMKSK